MLSLLIMTCNNRINFSSLPFHLGVPSTSTSSRSLLKPVTRWRKSFSLISWHFFFLCRFTNSPKQAKQKKFEWERKYTAIECVHVFAICVKRFNSHSFSSPAPLYTYIDKCWESRIRLNNNRKSAECMNGRPSNKINYSNFIFFHSRLGCVLCVHSPTKFMETCVYFFTVFHPSNHFTQNSQCGWIFTCDSILFPLLYSFLPTTAAEHKTHKFFRFSIGNLWNGKFWFIRVIHEIYAHPARIVYGFFPLCCWLILLS